MCVFWPSHVDALRPRPLVGMQPRNTWQDKSAYDSTAGDLRGRFEANFKQFESYVDEGVKKAGIYKAA